MGCSSSTEAAGALHPDARLYHQTKLASATIMSAASANRIVGQGSESTVVVLNPHRHLIKPFITVPDGFYGLVQRFGADVDYPATGKAVWPSGFHWAAPNVRVSHLVTKQAIAFSTPVKGVKTRDDVSCEINLTIVIRIMGDETRGEDPELVRTFVYRMRPRGLQQQLCDAQEEAVRALARAVNHDEVYALRGGVAGPAPVPDVAESKDGGGDLDSQRSQDADMAFDRSRHTEDLKRTLNDQFHQYGVDIVTVAITRVRLPPQFVQQMQDKTTYNAVIDNQRMRQENDMQLLGYKEELATLQQAKVEERDIAQARGEKLCSEETKELNSVLAETKQQVAAIYEHRDDKVRQLQAGGELKCAQINAQARETRERIMAEAKAEQSRCEAEADAFCRAEAASAAAEVARLEAEAARLVAEAEGRAAPMLAAKRAHEVRVKQLSVYEGLAANPNVAVSGPSAGNLMSDLLASKRGTEVMIDVAGAKQPPAAPRRGES